MSIDSKEFEKHKNPWKYIVDFLRKNSDRAFTAEYIAKETGLSAYEVTDALRWEGLASLIDGTYRSPIERATVKGVLYYKYKSA